MPSLPALNAPLADAVVAQCLAADRSQVMRLVERTYALFDQGQAVEVAPAFLRPPHDASARIIAKPACVYGDEPIAGLKWIASFPKNIAQGLPRATGLLILNDIHTGLAVGCMEASAINAHRTSASAVMALNRLHSQKAGPVPDISIIGVGPIGWQMAEYLVHEGWVPKTWVLHDLDAERAHGFAAQLRGLTPKAEVVFAESAAAATTLSDIVVYTTSAGIPHLHHIALRPEQTLLHISLRDLGVSLLEHAANFVDSAELAFSNKTSLHLAEEALGHRNYLTGEIGRVLQGGRPAGQAVVFSPFGMGILDLAVGQWVLKQTAAQAQR